MHRQRNIRAAMAHGFSLVEILVVCAILAILAACTYSVMLGHSKPTERARGPLQRAQDPVCINNLSQIRDALKIAQMDSEDQNKFPATLAELKGLPKSMLECPDSHQPYQYDSQTGEVHCTRAGHEKF